MTISVAQRLAKGAVADIMENPSLAREAASHGEDYVRRLVATDILNGIRGEGGPVLFPNIRGAVKDVMGATKSAKWRLTGRIGLGDDSTDDTPDAGLPGVDVPAYDPMASAVFSMNTSGSTPAPVPVAAASDDWKSSLVTSAPSSSSAPAAKPATPAQAQAASSDWTKVISSSISAIAGVGSAVFTGQIAKDTASQAIKMGQKLTAAQQAALAAQQKAAQSSIFGGGSSTMMIVGAVAILGVGAFMAFKGSGSSNGGGSSRRRSTKRRRR